MFLPFCAICVLCLANKIDLSCFSLVYKQSCFLICSCCYSMEEEEEKESLLEKPFPVTFVMFLVFLIVHTLPSLIICLFSSWTLL